VRAQFLSGVSYAQLLVVSRARLRVLVDSQLKMKLVKVSRNRTENSSVCGHLFFFFFLLRRYPGGIEEMQGYVRTSMHNETHDPLDTWDAGYLCKLILKRRVKVCNGK